MQPAPTIAIIGCGAVGSFLCQGFLLHQIPVTMYAKTEQVPVLTKQGIKVENKIHYPEIRSIDSFSPLYDFVFVAIKDYSLKDFIQKSGRTLAQCGAVVFSQNGLPLWLQDLQNHIEKQDNFFIDFPLEKIIGAVSYTAVESAHFHSRIKAEGDLIIGSEFFSQNKKMLHTLYELMLNCGFRVVLSTNITRDYWHKLYGNIITGPLCTLYLKDVETLLQDAQAVSLAHNLLQEMILIAQQYNIDIPISPLERLSQLSYVGKFKSSMLQDKIAGKPLEIDAILGRLIFLAENRKISVPYLESLYVKLGG